MFKYFILFWLCMLIHIIKIQSHPYELYVTDIGHNEPSCGVDVLSSCGTLYYLSMLINANDSYSHSKVIIKMENGQNLVEINNHHTNHDTNNYNPCLPVAFNENIDVEITFNDRYIQTMNDWYPIASCDNDNIYNNQYIFDGGKSLTITNLNIINHSSYNFIRNNQNGFTCYDCTFSDISILSRDTPLFHTSSNITLINNIFNNLTVFADLIYGIAAPNIIIHHSLFSNIILGHSLVKTDYIVHYDSINDRAFISFDDCQFHEIVADIALINDVTHESSVNITNIEIYDIIGSIYISDHWNPSYLYFENISISTQQTNLYNHYGLFFFTISDVTYINEVDIIWIYNITDLCDTKVATTNSSLLNVSCPFMSCTNPVAFMINEGEVFLDGVYIDILLLDPITDDRHDFTCYAYKYNPGDSDGSILIRNYHEMKLNNFHIYRSLGEMFLLNEGHLSVSNLVMSLPENGIFDPNVLQTDCILWQNGKSASLYVDNSNFRGALNQIWLMDGSAEIYNSRFENGTRAIRIEESHGTIVSNCEFEYMGSYFSRLDYSHPSLSLWESNNALLQNNRFHSYDPTGLLWIDHCSNVSLLNNTFDIQTKGFFYNIMDPDIFFVDDYWPLMIDFTVNSTVIDNIFNENPSDSSWISYRTNEGIHCLSGNTYFNYALDIYNTNITSCFRKDLIQCLYDDDINCVDGMYGNIEKSLYNTIGSFIVDNASNMKSIFIIHDSMSHIALDNINITVLNTNYDTLVDPLVVDAGNVLIVDSYVSISHDILYAMDKCDILFNERLRVHTSYIHKLMIKCREYNSSNILQETIKSSKSKFVNQLTATKINISTTSLDYYPGEFLSFDYKILDRLNNEINDNLSTTITVQLTGEQMLSDLNIYENRECPICDVGIQLNAVSLSSDLNTQYRVDVSVVDNILVSTESDITLNIIGCPISYGSDMKEYQCEVCGQNRYNLMPNNSAKCKSCDGEENTAVHCSEGNIHIEANHWLGFENDTIISSLCPASFCCMAKDHCDYIDNKKQLCAENRDHNSALCGRCIEGYSESMVSTACVKCDTNYYFMYLLIPCCLAFVAVIYLISSAVFGLKFHSNKQAANIDNKEDKIVTDWLRVKVLFSKIIMYYEQAISQILSSSSSDILLYTFASFFNLSTYTALGNNTNDIMPCFIDGLTAKFKIIMEIYVPSMIVALLSVFAAISKYARCGQQLNFPKIYIKMSLIIIGKVLEILFKLLNCQSVGSNKVHFYFGYEKCYGVTWSLSLSFLIFMIVAFTVPFILLKRMEATERANNNNALSALTYCYEPQYYYWEYITFIRRVVIALFSVSVHDSMATLAFIFVLCIFLLIEYKYKPFKVEQANSTEFVLILSLIMVISIDVMLKQHPIFRNLLLSFFIIFPFAILSYYIYLFIKHKSSAFVKKVKKVKKRSKSYENDKCNDDIEVKDLEIGAVPHCDLKVNKKRISTVMFDNPLNSDRISDDTIAMSPQKPLPPNPSTAPPNWNTKSPKKHLSPIRSFHAPNCEQMSVHTNSTMAANSPANSYNIV